MPCKEATRTHTHMLRDMILINTTAAHHLVSIRNHIQPMPSLTQVWLSRNSGACCRSLRRLYQCFPAAEEAGVYDSVLNMLHPGILSYIIPIWNLQKHDQTCMSSGYFLTHPQFSTDPILFMAPERRTSVSARSRPWCFKPATWQRTWTAPERVTTLCSRFHSASISGAFQTPRAPDAEKN